MDEMRQAKIAPYIDAFAVSIIYFGKSWILATFPVTFKLHGSLTE
jgi:hypothetical protein